MHPRLQRQVRLLDRWEAEFLAAVRKLLQARVNALEPVVKAALEPGGEKVVEKLGRLRALPGDYLPLLERYVGHLLVEGMVQGRSDVAFLRSRLQRRGVRLASRVDGEPVVPEDAIDYIRHRRDLGRFFEQDQVDTVRTILDNGLKEGASVKQVMDALQAALPDAIGKARAENIARTEATTAFNQGRLAAFREAKGFVSAVEFMAITDARTTPICMERDGLVLSLNDPDLPANTPPLHYMCRSVLSPVSEFELEDLGGQAYMDKQREKLERLPAPLKGFGNEPGLEGGRPPGQPPVVRTPSGPKEPAGGEAGGVTASIDRAANQPIVAGDGGVGYSKKPGNRSLESRSVVVGKQRIPVLDFWKGKGELECVQEAIVVFHPSKLDGIGSIRFTNEGLIAGAVPSNARCIWKKQTGISSIVLSRAAARDWSNSADPETHVLSVACIRHEVAHHAWFTSKPVRRKLNGGRDVSKLQAAWEQAMERDGVRTSVPIDEFWAQQVEEYLKDPVRYEMNTRTKGRWRRNMARVIKWSLL